MFGQEGMISLVAIEEPQGFKDDFPSAVDPGGQVAIDEQIVMMI
jgi:hypothetical protein